MMMHFLEAQKTFGGILNKVEVITTTKDQYFIPPKGLTVSP